jgi:mono/diheme cytochrome c family protein
VTLKQATDVQIRGGLVKTLLLACTALAAVFALWMNASSAISEKTRAEFDAAVVARGARLAAIADCAGCHTAAGRAPYAGGVALKTPFGTIHGTNITPDPATGIGDWTQADFMRAMRDGIARDGRHLYPAFPYDHFTHVADDDLAALYAYLMTRTPVEFQPPRNDLRFPFNIRSLLTVWNFFFLQKNAAPADGNRSAEWNRGAYLVQSLGHCGACHSPRNALGAEKRKSFLSGGEAEGWYAPPLDRHSPSPVPWTVDSLTAYLRTGVAEEHAIAGGPMQGVVNSLAQAPLEDVRAIAVYIVDAMGEHTAEREALAANARARAAMSFASPSAASAVAGEGDVQPGAAIYAATCAGCHEQGREISSGGALQLPLAVALYDADPRSLIRIILDGIAPAEGERYRWMPSFEGALTDEQMAALLGYLRTRVAAQAPWPDLQKQIAKAQQP